MHIINEQFQGLVATRAGAGQAVGRIGIGNLGVGLPRTHITGLRAPKIVSVIQPGDARARALYDE